MNIRSWIEGIRFRKQKKCLKNVRAKNTTAIHKQQPLQALNP